MLTSPEAARVFAEAWNGATSSGSSFPLRIASVGRGTTAAIQSAGLDVDFEPSTANAESLALELPASLAKRVLYAASAIAPGTLQKGLEARGFVVDRLNTYTTQPVLKHSAEDLALMEQSAVATFGSPSAVRAWAQATEKRPIAACIGGTSRDAAEEAGFDQILCPEKPGIPGWAEVTVQAIRQVLEAR